jgi:hypothetical protein
MVPEPGYCLDCDEPKNVIHIRVRGWPNKFPVCKDCLGKMIVKFENSNGKKEVEKP